MKLIISPAKKMRQQDGLSVLGTPRLLDRAEQVLAYLQSLSYEEAKALWKCNDQLATLNYDRICHGRLDGLTTPAILAYEGIQYQYMAPGVMEQTALDYLQAHLRILSGLYGILRPFDGIIPYRLEMQARADINGSGDLYRFWGDLLYRTLREEGDDVIVNLASKEYSKCIQPYLQSGDRWITVNFCTLSGGKLTQKATMAKMARGEMVRYLAEVGATSPEQLRDFNRLNFRYSPEHSDEGTLVFVNSGSAAVSC